MDPVSQAAVSRIVDAARMIDPRLGMSARELSRYSLARAIAATVPDPVGPAARAEAGLELEASRALAQKLGRDQDIADRLSPTGILVPPEVLQRAMSTTPGAKGGYMVGTDSMGFVDVLRARSVAMRMGARVVGGLVGNVTAPRGTTSVTTTWQATDGTSVSVSGNPIIPTRGNRKFPTHH